MHKAVEILKRTREGREALLEMIQNYGGFSNPTANDPLEQARLVAKRGIATDIMQLLLTDELNAFTVMMNERHVRLESQRAKGNDENDRQ